MIIDFHTHAFPDKLADKAVAHLYELGGMPPKSDGKISGLIRCMDEDGVDASVVLSIATKPQQETNVNNFAISLLENPRIIPFGSVFPGSDTALTEIERLHKSGVKGIKMHPEYQDFYIDEDRVAPIYKKCGELGMIVLLHCGGDVAYEPPYHGTPELIEKIVNKFCDTTFVAAHMGGFDLWEEFANTVKPHKNLYIDTSMTNTAKHLDNEIGHRIFETHGYDKFLFGSDSPWERHYKSMEKLYSYGFSDEVNKKILGENAVKLLGI
ncbi:MAG: amidohydrolase [Clostridia bacterium]|nr:amidohydrolase [Clostridia bacterium]